jgi:hypothetical protein
VVGTDFCTLRPKAGLNLGASQNLDELGNRENQREMADVKRLKLPIPACNAGVLPPELHAHVAQVQSWHLIVQSSVLLLL